MPARSSYDFALVRVVPRVERGEFVNVGVILFCRTRRFLRAVIEPDERRIAALAPEFDLSDLRPYLDAIPRIAAGDSSAGPIARLSQAERFHWLVSPASAVVQPSPVHCGLCDDPTAALERLMDELVRPSGGALS